jgi:hypothetical protein
LKLKNNTSSEQKKLFKKMDFIKKLKSDIDGIDSTIAYINSFFEYFDYLKSSNTVYVYFLNFSDARGRLYFRSPVSIQAN